VSVPQLVHFSFVQVRDWFGAEFPLTHGNQRKWDYHFPRKENFFSSEKIFLDRRFSKLIILQYFLLMLSWIKGSRAAARGATQQQQQDGESLAAAVVFVTKPSWNRIKRILVAAWWREALLEQDGAEFSCSMMERSLAAEGWSRS
jgi:hypothetical protein